MYENHKQNLFAQNISFERKKNISKIVLCTESYGYGSSVGKQLVKIFLILKRQNLRVPTRRCLKFLGKVPSIDNFKYYRNMESQGKTVDLLLFEVKYAQLFWVRQNSFYILF